MSRRTRSIANAREQACSASGPLGGFTLIELLVVIAIIALLIGILLPALRAARLSGQQVVCLSNMKQIGMSTMQYAIDTKDQIWPVQPVQTGVRPDNGRPEWKNWAYRWINAAQTDGAGLLYDYVENLDEITECPTNKRRSGTGRSFNGDDNPFWDNVGGFRQSNELNFDYTMNGGAGGAKTYIEFEVYGIAPPVADYNGSQTMSADSMEVFQAQDRATRFRTLPIFVEESTYFYNAHFSYHDGRWSYGDELTRRHSDGGHIAYLDGSVELYKPVNLTPEDPSVTGRNAFAAWSVWLRTKRGQYYRTDIPVDNPRFPTGDAAWGWINAPRIQ